MNTLLTPRLCIDELSLDDGDFILALLNDSDFLRYIGDRGVRTLEDAHQYLREGPMASYQRHGFGLWRLSARSDGRTLGMCGLLQRDALHVPDLGYALLADERRQGYTLEACRAVLADAKNRLGLSQVAALVDPENRASLALLEQLRFSLLGELCINPDGDRSRLLLCEL
ncbi:GNAT family N-acetyltransferase [Aestuariirhabdus sp. Z084]|uniref:GNAT family N-acetyltransferase n=1 Tax=Aestuariirhabdus haliotis TaxID=2918751 RepID=UPI00201B3F6B|nr:GNAT family N-acetyltransferase [Aestuariirhabdus haliotis]MCL6417655.1 GNAT family N-acetyltransferase [Aestuariirhabdus haliotis]MCL6421583.1 GNAT family N-acetyltransferase [Aestuariirhabdus haliotis]